MVLLLRVQKYIYYQDIVMLLLILSADAFILLQCQSETNNNKMTGIGTVAPALAVELPSGQKHALTSSCGLCI